MSVVMKGGTSGCRMDYLPPVPGSGAAQPVLDTATSGSVPGTVHLQAQSFEREHASSATPDFLPTGATFPETGTDIADPTATTGGDASIFRGAPNTGTKGGPA